MRFQKPRAKTLQLNYQCDNCGKRYTVMGNERQAQKVARIHHCEECKKVGVDEYKRRKAKAILRKLTHGYI